MTTYTLSGYAPSDYIGTSQNGSIGVGVKSTWQTSDRLTITVTDDDASFSGGGGSLDNSQQTVVVKNSAGQAITSGHSYIASVSTIYDPSGTAIKVYEVAVSGYGTVAYLTDKAITPGVYYTLGSTSSSVSNVSYSSFVQPSWDPTAANAVQGSNFSENLQTGAGADSINAGGGNDTIYFGTGDDSVWGGDGNDLIDDQNGTQLDGTNYLDGGAGDDTIYAGNGNDTIWGGDGNDRIYGEAGNDSIEGGAGNDYIEGGDGDDVIDAGSGSNTVYGGAGNDRIDDETGPILTGGNEFHGGDGNDTIFSGDSADTVYGDAGNDVIDAEGGDDSIWGGAGYDTITAGSGNDSVWGGDDADLIYGGAGNDYIDGGTGNDTIWVGTGSNTVYGGDGNDSIDDSNGTQEAGPNLYHGGAGNDTMWSGSGNDTQYGEAGNDELHGEDGNDLLSGGSGDDTLIGGLGDDTLWGDDVSQVDGAAGDGNDSLRGNYGNDLMYGAGGNDTLFGGTENDTMFGGHGSDVFQIRSADGVDTIYGGEDDDGSDRDVLDFSSGTTGVSVDFGGWEWGSYSIEGGGSGQFWEIEQVEGSQGDDTISGGMAAETLSGGLGDDYLSGGVDDTESRGASEHDVLTGGAGHDTFATGAGYGQDIVTDFDMTLEDGATADQIDVTDLVDANGEPIKLWDVTVTDDGAGNAVLTFPTGESLLLQGVSPAQVSDPYTLYAMGVPCLVRGTLIATPQGMRPIEEIRAGELVETERGPQPVLWAGCREVTAGQLQEDPRLLPVVVQPGALGNRRELRLSRQHCIAFDTPRGPALVRAGHLLDRMGGKIRLARGMQSVSYHHLLLPRHGLLRSDGMAVESLWPGPVGLRALERRAQFDLARQVPWLAPAILGDRPVEALYGAQVLPVLRRVEVARMIDALKPLDPEGVVLSCTSLPHPSLPPELSRAA